MSDTFFPAVPDESPEDESLPLDIFSGLSLKEAAVVRHYVETGNKRQSLLAAGYSPNTAVVPDKVFARPRVAQRPGALAGLHHRPCGRQLGRDY